MTTLFLAWQDTVKSRSWYAIGRLDADSKKNKYQFSYIHGAKKAQKEVGMRPLESFPDLHKKYESDKLFPLFQNRILSSSREEFEEYIKWLGLNPATADPLEILAISEGRRLTDNLEVFPLIRREQDGSFHCLFFLHGWHHICDCAHKKIENLAAGQPLRVSIELNNPVTGLAVQLSTPDYHMVGWSPRYLVIDLVRLINKGYQNIQAKVIKINPDPAPTQQRILVEISGKCPADFQPMSSEDFQDIDS